MRGTETEREFIGEGETMTDKELADSIGTIVVNGTPLTGEALVKYLNQMPPADKVSMLEDMAWLNALATMEESWKNLSNFQDP